jgi:hypothetical protein
MDKKHLFISIVAGLLNFILSLILPVVLKGINVDIINNIRKVFSNNKELLLTSSLIIVILVYLALSISPKLMDLSNLSNL